MNIIRRLYRKWRYQNEVKARLRELTRLGMEARTRCDTRAVHRYEKKARELVNADLRGEI